LETHKPGFEEVFTVTDYKHGQRRESQTATGSFAMKNGVVLRPWFEETILCWSLSAVPQTLKQSGGKAAAITCRQVISIPMNYLPARFDSQSPQTLDIRPERNAAFLI
jgi:hypothetical protein